MLLPERYFNYNKCHCEICEVCQSHFSINITSNGIKFLPGSQLQLWKLYKTLTTVRSEDNGPPPAQPATLASIGRANDSPGSRTNFHQLWGFIILMEVQSGQLVEVELEEIQCHHHHQFNSFYFPTLPFPVSLAPSIIVN